MRLDEILASRKTGKFYMGDDETPASRLARILPEFGLSPEDVGSVVAAYYADREQSGPAFTLQRVTKTENDKIKALAKQKEKTFNRETKTFSEGGIDGEDYTYLRLAYAITAPEIPGEDLRAKADYLAANLTPLEAQELQAASFELDRFNLSRAQELVKN